MKKVALSVMTALAFSAPAFAADMPVKAAKVAAAPNPWDVAFGAGVMSDYIFRGVTQSAHQASVTAYVEPRYNINKDWQLYAGFSYERIKFANNANAELDFYGGIRPTFGPLALDFGFWEYYYPGGTCFGGGPLMPNGLGTGCQPALANTNVIKQDVSFYEFYAKATYTLGDWAFGPTLFYSPNFLNTGADGTYVSGIVKYTAPAAMALPGGIGWYVSGEFGRQYLGTSDAFYGVPATPNGIDYADYNTWNVGIGFTWNVATLDLRYSDTDLSKGNCNAFTSDPGATGTTNITRINPSGLGSNWCGAAFVAKLSVDFTASALAPK